jgi:uncharacterized protein
MLNRFVLALMLATLGACVTINIYFPAAAAEKAADKIIDKVLSSEQAPARTAPPPAAPAGTKPAQPK